MSVRVMLVNRWTDEHREASIDEVEAAKLIKVNYDKFGRPIGAQDGGAYSAVTVYEIDDEDGELVRQLRPLGFVQAVINV